ncbi:unnamed protein product [Lasius platythorax]|uniref:Caspase-1 n=1 Tax=Lasius platythorax TaxID=488582 RepID=A0AAV2N8C2_9HYME
MIDDDNLIDKKPTTYFGVMPVPIDADCYNMNHKHRGKCVIFNHEEFDGKAKKRENSRIDVIRLHQSFFRLGFDVEIQNDLKYVEVMDKIKKVSQYDHTDNDCLCIIVLTHGDKKNMIWAKDIAYKSKKIWKPFTADKCPTLAGKPKLFFFQTCRGNKVDRGIVLSSRTLLPSEATDNGNRSEVILQNSYSCRYRQQIGSKSYKIPTHADILIAHSSVQGFRSWSDPVNGTWFIQCLCKVLNEKSTEMHLMDMWTLIKQKVATEFATFNPMDKTMHDTKQMPSETSMLIRFVYFPPKLNEKITTA